MATEMPLLSAETGNQLCWYPLQHHRAERRIVPRVCHPDRQCCLSGPLPDDAGLGTAGGGELDQLGKAILLSGPDGGTLVDRVTRWGPVRRLRGCRDLLSAC